MIGGFVFCLLGESLVLRWVKVGRLKLLNGWVGGLGGIYGFENGRFSFLVGGTKMASFGEIGSDGSGRGKRRGERSWCSCRNEMNGLGHGVPSTKAHDYRFGRMDL